MEPHSENPEEIAAKRQKVDVEPEPENKEPEAKLEENVGTDEALERYSGSEAAPPPPPLPQQAYWPGALPAPAGQNPSIRRHCMAT